MEDKLYGLIVISIITASILISSLLLITQVQAQIDPNDRFFAKDFCANEATLLNGINYQNGEDLSYGSQGCPISQIDIHRWNEISTSSKIIINSRMATSGYVDVTQETVNGVIQ